MCVFLSLSLTIELSEALLTLDLFNEWIIDACSFWEKNQDGGEPCVAVAKFVLELTAIVAKKETRFLHLSNNNVYQRQYNIFRLNRNECPPAIALAYVKLLASFLKHR